MTARSTPCACNRPRTTSARRSDWGCSSPAPRRLVRSPALAHRQRRARTRPRRHHQSSRVLGFSCSRHFLMECHSHPSVTWHRPCLSSAQTGSGGGVGCEIAGAGSSSGGGSGGGSSKGSTGGGGGSSTAGGSSSEEGGVGSEGGGGVPPQLKLNSVATTMHRNHMAQG